MISEPDMVNIHFITAEASQSNPRYEPYVVIRNYELPENMIHLYGQTPSYTHGVSERLTREGYKVLILDDDQMKLIHPGPLLQFSDMYMLRRR